MLASGEEKLTNSGNLDFVYFRGKKQTVQHKVFCV